MIKVGLILYSVRGEMEHDPIGTVERVAQMGYKNIEVCNHNAIQDPGCGFGVDAPTLKAAFDKFGSKVVSAHVFPFEKSDMQAVIAYNQALGNHNIVNPMGKFSTYDDLMRQCEDFNRWGKICREAGMTYLYHNHDHEYRTFGGKAILDLIAENTDPDYLSFELDTFWAMRGGADPVEVMKRLGARLKLVHQKDFSKTSTSPVNLWTVKDPETLITRETFGEGMDPKDFCEIGTGIMDIQTIIDTANALGAEYIVLEQDHTQLTQMESVRISMDSFKKFSGLDW